MVWLGENMPRGKSSRSVASHDLLNAALQGLEAQKKKIEDHISQVRALLGHRGAKPAANVSGPAEPAARRRQLSLAARRRIGAAQKRRWAEYHKRAGQTK